MQHEIHYNVFYVLIQIVFFVLKRKFDWNSNFDLIKSNLVLPVLIVDHHVDRLRREHDADDDQMMMKNLLIQDELI